jgi:SAM-dependent methyltransferase
MVRAPPSRRQASLGHVPDAIFSHPRLARVYDPLDPDRSDLDGYVELVDELGAATVLDVGCGTGTLACRLSALGVQVLGVDPAEASVAVAQGKPGADRVEWMVGTAADVASDPGRLAQYDLATMTANVAQVFLDDEEWLATLRAIHHCLRAGGHLAFETRVPADRGWTRWTKELTHQVVEVEGEGLVEDWVQVTAVDGELVTFESPTIFHADGERIDSTSTLRFRGEEALRSSLERAGFTDVELRDLPYALGRGWLVVARR